MHDGVSNIKVNKSKEEPRDAIGFSRKLKVEERVIPKYVFMLCKKQNRFLKVKKV